MSQPLIDLQSLLMAQTPTSGQVVSLTNGVARVATPGGIIEASVDTGIQPGDRLTVSNGRAIKNQVATSNGIVEVSADTGIQPGDRVTVSNGRAIKNQGATNTPVHFV